MKVHFHVSNLSVCGKSKIQPFDNSMNSTIEFQKFILSNPDDYCKSCAKILKINPTDISKVEISK